MSDLRDVNDVALPRRIRRQHMGRTSNVKAEIQDQVNRYPDLCGPVTVTRVEDVERPKEES